MTAYCTLADVKRRMTGDVPNMGPEFDNVIIDVIRDVGAEFDREVALARAQPPSWSFLAPVLYGRQFVMIGSTAPVTGGTFTLTSGASTTTTIAYNASAATVQAALVTILGGGNVTVSGPPGGPWTVTFAGALSGPQPVLVGTSSLTTSGGGTTGIAVQELVAGSASLTVTRRYTGVRGGSSLLMIDDAVSVASVQILSDRGSVLQTLVAGQDYLPSPLNTLPITGLERIAAWWPWTYGGVGVALAPGLVTATPPDLREAVIEESAMVYLSAQAAPDGREGIGSFGAVVTSHEFNARTWLLIESYSLGSALFRRPS